MQIQDSSKQKEFLRKYENINRQMEEDETANRATTLGLRFIDLSRFPVDLNALGLLTRAQAEDSQAVVFYKEGGDVRIGAVDPNNALLQQHVEEFKSRKFKPQVYMISVSSLKQILPLYEKVTKEEHLRDQAVNVNSAGDYKKKLEELVSSYQTSATDIISDILGAAWQLKASDIHIEPEENIVKVRLRLDGVLNDIVHLPKAYQKALLSRIKVISKLKLNIETAPQDGRFTYKVDGKASDVRVSLLPSAYGETVVMRILHDEAKGLRLEDLGFVGKAFDVIKEQLVKPNGMIITTGPTGSGKTTTLYAFLNQLNQPGVNIITLEDPVEYKLEGINQTPIDSKAGLDFASGLRAILRQDPDVIMVGEIRDKETAEVALQASLTGHVVLSTLHTNDAAGAIPRLLNMDIKPFVVAPALNAIIAQRLVRRICQNCKTEAKPDPFVLTRVKSALSEVPKNSGVEVPDLNNLKFYRSTGCSECGGLGYKGRIGIYEVLEKSNELDALIMKSASITEIKNLAVSKGMLTMIQDGLLKALQGITDVEEVFRVAQE